MALHLYRRHHGKCRAHHEQDSYSSELEERRRGWKHCDCTIHLSGTLGGRFSRRATGKTTWEDALKCATILEAAGTWGESPETSPLPAAPSEPPANTAPPRVTVTEAIEVYLANRQALVAHPTFRKHRTFTTQLAAFAASRGYVMLDQFRPLDIDVFYATSRLADLAKRS